MKKFMISIAAICATLFFVSCGGDSTNPTKADDPDQTTDTDQTDPTTTEDPTDNPTDPTTTEDPTDNPTDPTTTEDPTDTDEPTNPTDEPTTEPTTDPEGCELSDLEKEFVGTWAQKIILRSSSSTTMAQNVPSVTTRYIVTEIKPDENCKLDFFKKGNQICRTANRTGFAGKVSQGRVGFNEEDGSKFNTIFHHWKPYQIPGHESDTYLEIAEEGGEKTFKLNKDWELRGANMTDPSTEPMIDSDSDSRIFDHDEDGNPAFSILFTSSLASGTMYYVQRLSHILTGKVVADGKIEGTVNWTDEQYAHQKTPNLTLRGQKTTETDETKSVFQLVKVDDSMDCETLLGNADTIFDIVDPNSDVPHSDKYGE